MRMNRGFAFSLDALVGIAIAVAASAVVVAVAQAGGEDQRIYDLSGIARDYLVLKYAGNKSIAETDVAAFTNLTLTETFPLNGTNWAAAELIFLPHLAACNNPLSCALSNSSTQAALFQRQDIDRAARKMAWVKWP